MITISERAPVLVSIVFSVLILAPGVVLGAEFEKPVMLESTERFYRGTLEQLRTVTVDKKDETIQLANELLDQLDSQIYEIEMKIDSLAPKESGVLVEELRHSMAALNKRRAEIDRWLHKLEQESVRGWGDALSHFIDAFDEALAKWDEISTEAEKVVSRVQSGDPTPEGESAGSETPAQAIDCPIGLKPIILYDVNKTKCVTSTTASTLLERGQARLP